MVEDITRNFDAIYRGRGRALILAKRLPVRRHAFVQFEPSDDGDFYDVKTATPSRKKQWTNKKPLWERVGQNTSTTEVATVNPSVQSGPYNIQSNSHKFN